MQFEGEDSVEGAAVRDQPLVCVVIPARDAERSIGLQLRALEQQERAPRFEVVVVDNGSKDRTIEVALGFSERLPIRIVEAAEVVGPSHARNVGVESTAAPIVLFCDADDRVSRRWVGAYVDALKSSTIATGPTLYFDRIDGVSEPAIEGRLIPTAPRRYLNQRVFAPSNNLAIRVEAFRLLGGFDTSIRCGEDADLSIRAQEVGLELGWVQDAVVYYARRDSARTEAKQFFRYGFYDAAVYKKLRGRGLVQRPPWTMIRPYLVLAFTAYRLLGVGRRPWLAKLAHLVGRIVGSARYRVFCP